MKNHIGRGHGMAFFLALAVGAPLALGSCGGSDGPSGPSPSQDPPPPPPPPGQPSFDHSGSLLAFRHTASGRQDIWLINLEQLLVRNLTNHSAPDSDPAWSPDGSKLAFVSQRSGNSELWVINADGSGLTQVTSNQGDVRFPDWSPDGNLIAYSANVGGQRDLYVIAAPGADASLVASMHPGLAQGPVQVTNNSETDNEPVWTPDGSGFYFFSSRNDCSGIYHTTFEGTTTENKVVKLSIDLAFDCNDFMCAPGKGFSVTAARHVITFVSDKNGADDIWVAEVDPSDPSKVSNPKNVSQSQADDFYSTFAQPVPSLGLASDAGSGIAASVVSGEARIFFDSHRTGRWQLWSVKEDGTDTKRLTNAVSQHQMPAFRPALGSNSDRRAAQAFDAVSAVQDVADAIEWISDGDHAAAELGHAAPMPLYDMAEPGALGRRSCERDH